MSFKNTIKMVMLGAMLGSATQASAANEGVAFFYGLGLGGVMLEEQVAGQDLFDPAAGASVFLGIEEKGWALEYSVAKTMDAGTLNPAIDYAVTFTHTSLGYRSIEKNKRYYLIKFGKADVEFDLKGGGLTGATDGATFEGNVYTLGIGWRMDKDERLEFDYSMYSSSDVDNVHILTARYLWGGNPSNEK